MVPALTAALGRLTSDEGETVRTALSIACLLACGAWWSAGARAQSTQAYADRPVRIVANFAVGGAIDASRASSGRSSPNGWDGIWSSKAEPGTGGNIGADAVAKAKLDGCTLLCTLDTTLTVNPSLYGKLQFDPASDPAPITLAAAAPLVLLTHAALPAPDVTQVFALAEARGGSLEFACGGSGSAGRLAGVLLGEVAGIEFLRRAVRGRTAGGDRSRRGRDRLHGAQLYRDRAADQGRSGGALAVTGPRRAPAYPGLPNARGVRLCELRGRVLDRFPWPAGAPPPILARLHAEIVKALPQPEVRNVLGVQGFETVGNSPEALGAIIERDRTRWTKVVKEIGAKADWLLRRARAQRGAR